MDTVLGEISNSCIKLNLFFRDADIVSLDLNAVKSSIHKFYSTCA
jgi:hypothetical protein